MNDAEHLAVAIRLAVDAATGGGGPFGAVVVNADGAVVGQGTNRVVAVSDPTAHAEVEALRSAAGALGTPDLSGCVVYTSCYPCPMCLVAIWWARVDRVVYGAEPEDAAAAGFDDRSFWDAVANGTQVIPVKRVVVPIATAPFEAWLANPKRVPY